METLIDRRDEVCTMLNDRLNDAAIVCARESGKPLAFWFCIMAIGCCEPLASGLKFRGKLRLLWRIAGMLFAKRKRGGMRE